LVAHREPALYRFSAWLFVIFLAFTVWAFWPSYFLRLFDQPDFWFHAHGVALLSWCTLLIVQAQLVRTGRRPWHRLLGKSSYVIAPAVVLISAGFVHHRLAGELRGLPAMPAMGAHFLALTLLSLALFAVFYGLAIAYRRKPQIHARWMIATVFPIVTPVSDRLIGRHWQSLIGVLPRIEGSPILPAAGFVLADLVVAALAVWDWRVNGRRDVFPLALAGLLIYHVGTLTLHRVPWWNAFCVWFVGLPLT
jgi:hypothetical protein